MLSACYSNRGYAPKKRLIMVHLQLDYAVQLKEKKETNLWRHNMENPMWRIEANVWFKNFDEYAAREKELIEPLGRIQGDGSVTVFLRATPEYVEIPGGSFDYRDTGKVDELVNFCGKDNIDFVARVGRNVERELGCLRWKDSGDE